MAEDLIEQEKKVEQDKRTIEFFSDFDQEIDLANADIEAKADEEEDFIKLVTNNETIFKVYAEKKLREHRNHSLSAMKTLDNLNQNAS